MLARLASSGTPPSTGPSKPTSVITASAGTACLASRSLSDFHADTLTRQLFEAGASGDAGGDPCRVERALAIGGMKAEEAQDAQVVFRDARGSVADEAHAPRLDVGEPADIVVDRAIARGGQRVHGEVAALGIALPVASERHLGMAAEGLDVFAQGGDFERPPVGPPR